MGVFLPLFSNEIKNLSSTVVTQVPTMFQVYYGLWGSKDDQGPGSCLGKNLEDLYINSSIQDSTKGGEQKC